MYSTYNKELSISLFMCFRIFNFGQIKMIFRGDENFKNNSLLKIKTFKDIVTYLKADRYFRTNCCLVINLKQNRF